MAPPAEGSSTHAGMDQTMVTSVEISIPRSSQESRLRANYSHTDALSANSGRNPVERRSVVRAAAWSAPVIALAVTAPAASASTVIDFDGAVTGLQMGSVTDIFNGDLTARYTVNVPLGFTFLNTGTVPIPAGTAASVTYDRRVFSPQGFEVRLGQVTIPLAHSVPVVAGDAATVTFNVPIEIQPNTDPVSAAAVLVITRFSMHHDYPNDAIDGLVTSRFAITLQDTNPANNSMDDFGFTTAIPAAPWGVSIDRSWAPYSWNGGLCHAELPSSTTFTSVGPHPTRAGDQIAIGYDTRLANSATVSGITLNGVPAPDLIAVSSVVASGVYGRTEFTVAQPLAAGDVLQAVFGYVHAPDAGTISDINRSSLNWNSPANPNDPDRRNTEPFEDSYNNNASCTLL